MDYALTQDGEPFLQTPEADMTFAQLVCAQRALGLCTWPCLLNDISIDSFIVLCVHASNHISAEHSHWLCVVILTSWDLLSIETF